MIKVEVEKVMLILIDYFQEKVEAWKKSSEGLLRRGQMFESGNRNSIEFFKEDFPERINNFKEFFERIQAEKDEILNSLLNFAAKFKTHQPNLTPEKGLSSENENQQYINEADISKVLEKAPYKNSGEASKGFFPKKVLEGFFIIK